MSRQAKERENRPTKVDGKRLVFIGVAITGHGTLDRPKGTQLLTASFLSVLRQILTITYEVALNPIESALVNGYCSSLRALTYSR